MGPKVNDDNICTRVFYIIILSRHISFAFSYYHEQNLPMPIKTNPQYAHISFSNPFYMENFYSQF